MTRTPAHGAIVYCLNSGYGRKKKKPCPGSRELERRALVGTDWRRALDGENLRRALRRLEWKGIKDYERPGGFENRRYSELSCEANPQVYVETPLHPEKLTVWGALLAGGIIGPYFFKNDEGHNVTVNGDRYRAMITNFFIPELNNHDVQELWI
ncbi:hypothetical protein TNCV_2646871 [Trichonephila clavipes]|nr:hypothetical protein TNCV_2646871 [Trichonephila clavipes]